jgi:phosphoserine aminotransferase
VRSKWRFGLCSANAASMCSRRSFGAGWVTDVVNQLKLKDVRTLKAGYGEIVDLKTVNFDNDVVFTWNGTTSGVRARMAIG